VPTDRNFSELWSTNPRDYVSRNYTFLQCEQIGIFPQISQSTAPIITTLSALVDECMEDYEIDISFMVVQGTLLW